MSGSDAELDLGDGSGTATLGGITTFLQGGGSATRVLTASMVGLITSPVVATVDIIDGVGTFISDPFESAGSGVGDLFEAFMTAPADLVKAGSRISESSLEAAFGDTIAGTLALPFTFLLAFGALFALALYLNENETSNTLPGLPDIPFFGREEEATDDE